MSKERFERHRQPWRSDEIAKTLSSSEEAVRDRAKEDGIAIARLR